MLALYGFLCSVVLNLSAHSWIPISSLCLLLSWLAGRSVLFSPLLSHHQLLKAFLLTYWGTIGEQCLNNIDTGDFQNKDVNQIWRGTEINIWIFSIMSTDLTFSLTDKCFFYGSFYARDSLFHLWYSVGDVYFCSSCPFL